MRWTVEIQYETMDGNQAIRTYNVTAKKSESAINLARKKLEYLKDYKKTCNFNVTAKED